MVENLEAKIMVTKKAQEASTIIVWCIVLMGLTLLIGVVAGEVRVKPVESTITQDTVIMSPRDFQALLNRLEPSQAIEEDMRVEDLHLSVACSEIIQAD